MQFRIWTDNGLYLSCFLRTPNILPATLQSHPLHRTSLRFLMTHVLVTKYSACGQGYPLQSNTFVLRLSHPSPILHSSLGMQEQSVMHHSLEPHQADGISKRVT